MTLKKRYIQVADKKDYFLSCNFKWESQARQSLRLRTFLFGSVTACEKSTTRKVNNCERHHTQLTAADSFRLLVFTESNRLRTSRDVVVSFFSCSDDHREPL